MKNKETEASKLVQRGRGDEKVTADVAPVRNGLPASILSWKDDEVLFAYPIGPVIPHLG